MASRKYEPVNLPERYYIEAMEFDYWGVETSPTPTRQRRNG